MSSGWSCEAEISREAVTLHSLKKVEHLFKTGQFREAKNLYFSGLINGKHACVDIFDQCDNCPLETESDNICNILTVVAWQGNPAIYREILQYITR